MKIVRDKSSLMVPIAVGIIMFVWLYFIVYFLFDNDLLFSQNNVTWDNVGIKFIADYIAILFIPTVIIIKNRKTLSDFQLCLKSNIVVYVLLAVMLMLFVLHNDYKISGFYRVYFYLIVIGFGEEFIYRGFVYNRIKGSSKVLAIILSGLFHGIPHAILPSITSSADLNQILIAMFSTIGGGILLGWYFIYLQEQSKTLWVPILVHAIIDYTFGYIGIITAIVIFSYYKIKSSRQPISIWNKS